jgi:DNA-binding winged helix-turn-helix (wHTH) protein
MAWSIEGARTPDLEISATPAALEVLGAPSWVARGDDESCVATTDARGVLLVMLSSEADTVAAEEAIASGGVALGIASGAALASDIRVDDVLFLPTSLEEVRGRALRAYARRVRVEHAERHPLVEDGVLQLEGRELALSASEQGLVEELLAARGSLVTRARLERVLGTPDSARALDAHIYRLRAKLRAIPALELLTVRQRGFRLVVNSSDTSRGGESPEDFCSTCYPPPMGGTR